jgi:hypothetical protein
MISPRPWRAIRAATAMRSRRSVAARALAQARLARDPAARSRLARSRRRPARPHSRETTPIWQVRQGPVGQVGEHLLDLGVVAVLLLGLQSRTGNR